MQNESELLSPSNDHAEQRKKKMADIKGW